MKDSSLFVSYLRLPLLIRVSILALMIIVLFGLIIHLIEPASFPHFFDGIWWAIVTVSTIGYGDFVPKTFFGRTVGIFLVLVGVSFMTYYFVTLASATVSRQNSFLEGHSTYRGYQHIVLVGWNERIRETLHQIKGLESKQNIILIDETLEKNPVNDPNITFIKGNPSHDDTLNRANVLNAELMIISADQSKNELNADMGSILTLIAAKGINPNLYCIAEILTSNQAINAKRAGADEVIQTNKLTSFVMTKSIVSFGMSETLHTLLDNMAGNKLEFVSAHHSHQGMTYQECVMKLLNDQKLLIGIKRGDESIINPSPTFMIQPNDLLLIMRH